MKKPNKTSKTRKSFKEDCLKIIMSKLLKYTTYLYTPAKIIIKNDGVTKQYLIIKNGSSLGIEISSDGNISLAISDQKYTYLRSIPYSPEPDEQDQILNRLSTILDFLFPLYVVNANIYLKLYMEYLNSYDLIGAQEAFLNDHPCNR